MYNVNHIEASHSCDHLYFKKQILYPGQFKIGGINSNCEYSHPVELEGNNYNHISQKLARSSILFTDKVSRVNHAAGIKVKFSTGNYEPMWGTNNHRGKEDKKLITSLQKRTCTCYFKLFSLGKWIKDSRLDKTARLFGFNLVILSDLP